MAENGYNTECRDSEKVSAYEGKPTNEEGGDQQWAGPKLHSGVS